MISKLRDLSMRTKIGAGVALAVIVLTAVIWYNVSHQSTPGLPTAAELREPFTPAKPGEAPAEPAVFQGRVFTDKQIEELKAGKKVTVNLPGGGVAVAVPDTAIQPFPGTQPSPGRGENPKEK